MTDATGRIKNLSIALEALSSSYSKPDFSDGFTLRAKVEVCLLHEINQLEKEQITPPIPPARPAATTLDDDIPF